MVLWLLANNNNISAKPMVPHIPWCPGLPYIILFAFSEPGFCMTNIRVLASSFALFFTMKVSLCLPVRDNNSSAFQFVNKMAASHACCIMLTII